MNRRVVGTAVVAWLLIAVLAIANGTLRQAVLMPLLPDMVAQVVSVAILAAVIAFLEWRLVRGRWQGLSRGRLLLIGTCWMLGTILFEFALGRLVLGMSWESLLQQYNILAGNLWPLIPLLMAVGMPIMHREAKP